MSSQVYSGFFVIKASVKISHKELFYTNEKQRKKNHHRECIYFKNRVVSKTSHVHKQHQNPTPH